MVFKIIFEDGNKPGPLLGAHFSPPCYGGQWHPILDVFSCVHMYLVTCFFLVLLYQWSSHFVCFSVHIFVWYIFFITAMIQGHAWFHDSCFYFLLLWTVSQTLFSIVEHIALYCLLWFFFYLLFHFYLWYIDHCFFSYFFVIYLLNIWPFLIPWDLVCLVFTVLVNWHK